MSDLSDVHDVHDRLGEIQLVDCREPYEWEAGRIDGAIHIPVNSIMAGAGGDLDHDKPVAVICRSGNRSELATMMLQARGYDATNVEGGMEAWAPAGLPFEAPTAHPAASRTEALVPVLTVLARPRAQLRAADSAGDVLRPGRGQRSCIVDPAGPRPRWSG